MELLKLKYFIAVARENSMQEAADSLHVAQSTLSTAVRNIEAELGVKLFRKAGRKLELTEAGHILLTEGGDLMERAENLVSRMRSLKRDTESSVTVGTEVQDFLSEAEVRYRSTHDPSLNVSRCLPRRCMIKPLLKSGQIDFALTLFDDSDSETESVLLIEEPYHLQVSRTHPLHDRERVHFSQLEGETLVTVQEHYGFRILCESFFGMAGIRPLAYYVVSDYETIPLYVRNGCGVGLIPHSIYMEMKEWLNYLCRIEIDDSFCARRIYLTRLKSQEMSSGAQSFADYLARFGAWTQEHGTFPKISEV